MFMTDRDLQGRWTSGQSGQLTHSVVFTASAVVLVLAGVVDFATSAELRRRLGGLIRSNEVVVVDMSEVHLVDAASIRVIVSAHATAAACGRHLYVDGLQGLPARVFAILGLDWLGPPDGRAAGATAVVVGEDSND